MGGVLRIDDRVVTGELLKRRHGDEAALWLSPRSVVTPTGWDYIREHKLEVSRAADAGGAPVTDAQIREVRPATADGIKVVPDSRCDYPDRAFGCTTEEFGSGFAEPEPSASSCPTQGEAATPTRASADSPEAHDAERLIQTITDRIMDHFRQGQARGE